MSLPSPEDYQDWRSFANALIAAFTQGGYEPEVLYTAYASTPMTGGTGEEPLPAGYSAIWISDLDAKLYLSNPTYDPPTIADLFEIDTLQIADAAISLEKLRNNSVDGNKLIDGVVSSAKIVDGAIITAKIADAAIISAKIGDAQITSAKISDLAVNTAHIANAAITSAKIANLAVGTANIVDGAITNAKIGTLAVNTANIVDGAIVSAKIADASIITAKIAALAVGTAQIANAAITTAKIGDAEITSAKIASLIVNKLASGTLDATIDVGTGALKFTIGGNALYVGRGFGTSNQFFFWFGPAQANLNTCSESLGVVWFRNDGAAYFGGSLSAGVLRNAYQTTSIANNAQLETPIYGSNGGTIQVVLSYSWSASQVKFYAADSTGLAQYNADVAAFGGSGSPDTFDATIAETGGAVISLERRIGAGAYGNVSTLTVSGGTRRMAGTRPTPGDAAGNATFTQNFGGSTTYTDPAMSTSDRQYRATITSRTISVLPSNQKQSVSIVSTE